MTDDIGSFAGPIGGGSPEESEVVEVRATPTTAILRAVSSAGALALTATILATATILEMTVAGDIGDAKLDSTSGLNDLGALRLIISVRVAVGGVALLLAIGGGVRYWQQLPTTRYTFADDDERSVETTVGSEPPSWLSMLVGASTLVSVLAIALNVIALIFAFHHHQRPNLFGAL